MRGGIYGVLLWWMMMIVRNSGKGEAIYRGPWNKTFIWATDHNQIQEHGVAVGRWSGIMITILMDKYFVYMNGESIRSNMARHSTGNP